MSDGLNIGVHAVVVGSAAADVDHQIHHFVATCQSRTSRSDPSLIAAVRKRTSCVPSFSQIEMENTPVQVAQTSGLRLIRLMKYIHPASLPLR